MERIYRRERGEGEWGGEGGERCKRAERRGERREERDRRQSSEMTQRGDTREEKGGLKHLCAGPACAGSGSLPVSGVMIFCDANCDATSAYGRLDGACRVTQWRFIRARYDTIGL